MMQRLRQALRRDFSSQIPQGPLRPNELRRDVVREERLRRQARAEKSLACRVATLERKRFLHFAHFVGFARNDNDC